MKLGQAFLVKHPTEGQMIFFSEYNSANAALMAVEYAESTYPVEVVSITQVPAFGSLSASVQSSLANAIAVGNISVTKDTEVLLEQLG